MQKICSLFLVLCLVFSLSACKNNTSATNSDTESIASEIISAEPESSKPAESSEVVESSENIESSDLAESSDISVSIKPAVSSKPTVSSKPAVSSKPTTATTTSATTNKPATTTKPSQGSLASLLNSAPLSPLKTNNSELDLLIESTFATIHTQNMTTYEKVKACYDYLVNNCSYGHSYEYNYSLEKYGYYNSNYDAALVSNAYSIFKSHIGVCDDYSAAFVVMCRRIGLNAYVVGGTVSRKTGGQTPHAWTYILLNGTKYVFDPQVQDNNPGVPYYYFGKTYKQMTTVYEEDSMVYGGVFSNFKKIYKLDILDIPTTINWGQTIKGSYCGVPENQIVTWESSAPEIISVDSEGTVIGKNQGTATITAKTTIDGKVYKNSIEVSCTKGVKKFEIYNSSDEYKLGETIILNRSLSYDPEILTDYDNYSKIEYVSSNDNVITIKDNIVIVASGVGSATITAKLIYKDDVKAEASVVVTVTN